MRLRGRVKVQWMVSEAWESVKGGRDKEVDGSGGKEVEYWCTSKLEGCRRLSV